MLSRSGEKRRIPFSDSNSILLVVPARDVLAEGNNERKELPSRIMGLVEED
jgi:hypothetical protein